MKISNSKKQLARIISDNGGWPRNADWAAQCKSDSTVSFYYGMAPYIEKGDDAWYGDYLGAEHDIDVGKVLPNWHQTILSSDEYFHLYPAEDAVAEEPEHVWTNPPTIEQLAAEYRNRQDYAERKQQEADEAKAEAEAKLAELVAAGKAVGLAVSVAAPEPELVITDWRDLRVGDEVEYLEGTLSDYVGLCGVVDSIDRSRQCGGYRINVKFHNGTTRWCSAWRFIRRPSKEADNA